MRQPKELSFLDFCDTIQISDGYDFKSMPDLTRDNFQILIEEHNNMVEVVNLICKKSGIVFNE